MAVEVRNATEKQIAFAEKLAAEVHGENAPEFLLAHREEGTFDSVRATSALIDALLLAKKAMPRAKVVRDEVADPEPGYYAVDYDGALRFYAVKEGKGRWDGYTFVNRFKSDALGRVMRPERVAVTTAILADPEAARVRFARETRHCYACGRRLTDAVSRELGIGPECRAKRA